MIKTIKSIDGFHVYRDSSISEDTPRFRKLNLIYGFNGSGKSTLGRVLGCQSKITPMVFSDSESFSITHDDNTSITNKNYRDHLCENTFVFNEDFINREIKWSDSKVNMIVVIGKKQKEAATELNAVRNTLSKLEVLEKSQQGALAETTKKFNQYKTDTARTIETSLNENRNYRSDKFHKDASEYEPNAKNLLGANEVNSCNSIIKSTEVPIHLQEIISMKLEISGISHVCLALNDRQLHRDESTIMTDDGEAISWIHSGLTHHPKPPSTCLFCNSELSRPRYRELQRYFSEEYDDFRDKLSKCLDHTKSIIGILVKSEASIPLPDKIDYSLRSQFTQASLVYRTKSTKLQNHIHNLYRLLDAKIRDMNTIQDARDILSDTEAESILDEIHEQEIAINSIISNHNDIASDYQNHIDSSKSRLLNHHLEKEIGNFRNYVETCESQSSDLRETISKIETYRATEAELIESMSKHAYAGELINSLISRHLGHDELELVPSKEGFTLHRANKPATAPPSEGEKNAIALAYFLILLKAEGRKLNELTIILDDPASSMDARSLHYTASLIEHELTNCSQLFLLTHNLQLMRDIRKWMFRMTEKAINDPSKEAKAEIFFLDCKQDYKSKTRTTHLCIMPKYLRDYDSEYHYYFWIFQTSLSSDLYDNPYIYMLPNAMRKILDIFLSFKDPGNSMFKEKLKRVANTAGIDSTLVLQLEKVVQVQSHADNVESIVSLPSITIEEIHTTLKTTEAIFKHLDSDHYIEMQRKCR